MNKKNHIFDFILYGVLCLYIFIMVMMLFFQFASPVGGFHGIRTYTRGINVIPLHDILLFLSGPVSLGLMINNLLGNIVVFIPCGAYCALFNKNKGIPVNLLIVFSISLSAEILQYLFACGISDIDDVLLNSLGGLIGIACYLLLLRCLKSEALARRFFTILSALLGIPAFVLIMALKSGG